MRALLRRYAPAGPDGRLSVLIFHRIRPVHDALCPFEVDAARFDRLCAWLAAWFQVLPLNDAVKLSRAGRLPDRAMAITFDDGYADNLEVAVPILKRHGLSATVFVATGFLDGGMMWNDRLIEGIRGTVQASVDLGSLLGDPPLVIPLNDLAARQGAISTVIGRLKYLVPDQRLLAVDRFEHALGKPAVTRPLMLRSEAVTTLHRAGMLIGAHTVSHPILAGLPTAEIAAEIGESQRVLQDLTGAPVSLFAYPNGKPGDDFDDTTVEVVRQLGFEAAFTTVAGAAGCGADPMQLPRFTPWERDRLRFGWRLAQNLAHSNLPPAKRR